MFKRLAIILLTVIVISSSLYCSALSAENTYFKVSDNGVVFDGGFERQFDEIRELNYDGDIIGIRYAYTSSTFSGINTFKYVIEVKSGKGVETSFTWRLGGGDGVNTYLADRSKIYSDSGYGTVTANDRFLEFKIKSDSPVIYLEASVSLNYDTKTSTTVLFDEFSCSEYTSLGGVVDEDYGYDSSEDEESISALTDITVTLSNWMVKALVVRDFFESGNEEILNDLEPFKVIVWDFVDGLPTILHVLILFGLTLLVLRKVLGR